MADRARPQPPFRDAGFFVLRTPLLPFDELLGWSEDVAAPPHARDTLAAIRATLRGRLRAMLERPELREAVRVASPSLAESIAVWHHDPDSERGRKVERSLVRYVERMCTRSTPFGLFAGCSLGTIASRDSLPASSAGEGRRGSIGDTTELDLGELAGYRRHTRLDMDYVCNLADALREPLRAELTVRPNSGLYCVAGQVRYLEAHREHGHRAFRWIAIDRDEQLDCLLSAAAPGARPSELAEALLAQFSDVTREDADAYVTEAIDSQLLVSDLEPPLTGPEPVGVIQAQLSSLSVEPARSAARALTDVMGLLAALDARPLGSIGSLYDDVARVLEPLPAKVDPARLVQVDLVKPARTARLGTDVLAEVRRAVQIFHRLARVRDDSLAAFRRAFVERYESREVPLVEALDDELGIGFGGRLLEQPPLLAGINLPGRERALATTTWDRREAVLLPKIERVLRTGAIEIELDERDLEAMSANEPPAMPDAFGVMATLFAPSPDALARGDFAIHCEGTWGEPGVGALGRFCHADPDLEREVRAYIAAVEQLRPEVTFAEIVHLPQGRIGNIVLRPLLRGHEIVFHGRSGASAEQQIHIDDLVLSVVDERLVVRSKRLGSEVVPRLTSAHNHAALPNLAVYRFLCALQGQGAPVLGWSWGGLDGLSFLPRLRCGRIVLSLARWRLRKDEIDALSRGDADDWYDATQTLRRRLQLPRWVRLADYDNLLPVDLDNPLSIEAFVSTIKNRESLDLQEAFPGDDGLVVTGPEGRFTHELFIPFVSARPADPVTMPVAPSIRSRAGIHSRRAAPPKGGAVRSSPARRSFAPGDEWLYAKLYCGPATSDRILLDLVGPLVDEVRSCGGAESWFFVRYADPHHHLRLRFRGQRDRLRGTVLRMLNERAATSLERGYLSRIQIDTYDREVERYGGTAGIALAEELFEHDSDTAVRLLRTLGGVDSQLRWQWTLASVDRLLSDLGLDLVAKRALSRSMRAEFGREFGADARTEHQLGARFRKERTKLEALLAAGPALGHAADVLAARSTSLAPVVRRLREHEQSGELTSAVETLAASYVHMLVNRMTRSLTRAQELVIYDFIERLYDSQAARQRARSRESTAA